MTAVLHLLLALVVAAAAVALVLHDPHGTGLAVHHALLRLGAWANAAAGGK